MVGPETAIACNRAIALWKHLSLEERWVAVAAGDAGKEWDHVIMSTIMADYIKMASHDMIKPIQLLAKTFDTDGEVLAIRDHLGSDRNIKKVIAVVKWWHAPKVEKLLEQRLIEVGLLGVQIEISECPSHTPRVYAWAYMIATIPKDFLRLFRERWQMWRNGEKWKWCKESSSYTKQKIVRHFSRSSPFTAR